MSNAQECAICAKISAWKDGRNPKFVHEFRNTLLVVGDHQFFPGYCLLLLKEHVREPHDLPPNLQQGLFWELMTAGKAITAAYSPWKLNYASLGNVSPHVHWHLIPRYETDPHCKEHPWFDSARFQEFETSVDVAAEVAQKIRVQLSQNK